MKKDEGTVNTTAEATPEATQAPEVKPAEPIKAESKSWLWDALTYGGVAVAAGLAGYYFGMKTSSNSTGADSESAVPTDRT